MKILVLGGTGAMGGHLVNLVSQDKSNCVYVTSRTHRETQLNNTKYIQGNAHELSFIKTLLEENRFDVIVDFMNYSSDEFLGRVDLFLNNTGQYIFLSSSRVYADSHGELLTEESPRLLDISTDSIYLKSDEYALAKAREEDIFMKSGKRNWTIIRPYITYSTNRLQLGVYEKEQWLFRALSNRPIVFTKDIAVRRTTLTSGYDVANIIWKIMKKKESLGEIFHVTGEQFCTWGDILDIYYK